MDFQFRIFEAPDLLVETFCGKIRIDDLIPAIAEVYAHPAFRPDMAALVDLRRASLDISYRQMCEFVLRLQTQSRIVSGRWAFLVSHPADFGICRIYEAIAENIHDDVAVFYDWESATAWLGAGGARDGFDIAR